MQLKRLPLILGTSLWLAALWGCDPMRRIRMQNQSGETAEVIWTIKEDSIHASPLYISNTKEVVFTLTPKGPGNYISLSCGVGKWTPHDVEALADDLESLVIKWNKGEIRLDSSDKIKNFLLPRRKGADGAKIMILVKE